MDLRQLKPILDEIIRRYPDAELVKNSVGNYSIMQDNVYIGWLDLQSGMWELFND